MKRVCAGLCLAALIFITARSTTSGESTQGRGPGASDVAGSDGEAPVTGSLTERSAADSFAQANWSLDAEPGAVRKHQRIDPATGKPVPLSDKQVEASDADPQSAIERLEADQKKKAKWKQIGFGDPNAETEAVR